MRNIIDLRSDTLSKPTPEMLAASLSAELGDAGRLEPDLRGSDPTVNELEDLAASMTGKEAAAFLCSGTMGNSAALMTHAKCGDDVLVESDLHCFKAEKFSFDQNFGRLSPVFYECDDRGLPNVGSVERAFASSKAKLLCLENSHNNHGGVCIPMEMHRELRRIADKHGARIHLDGARLFNAAAFLGVPAREIAGCVDTVMFCVSKGLGAPFGSLVCGERAFIDRLRTTQKLFGGGMRQAGVMAAPAIYALKHCIGRLADDNRHARETADALLGLDGVRPQKHVETNILMLDTAMKADDFVKALAERGVLCGAVAEHRVRLVFYREIGDAETARAIEIIKSLTQNI